MDNGTDSPANGFIGRMWSLDEFVRCPMTDMKMRPIRRDGTCPFMEINAANCQSFQLEFYSSGDKIKKTTLTHYATDSKNWTLLTASLW